MKSSISSYFYPLRLAPLVSGPFYGAFMRGVKINTIAKQEGPQVLEIWTFLLLKETNHASASRRADRFIGVVKGLLEDRQCVTVPDMAERSQRDNFRTRKWIGSEA